MLHIIFIKFFQMKGSKKTMNVFKKVTALAVACGLGCWPSNTHSTSPHTLDSTDRLLNPNIGYHPNHISHNSTYTNFPAPQMSLASVSKPAQPISY
jgi:hypothetical protein